MIAVAGCAVVGGAPAPMRPLPPVGQLVRWLDDREVQRREFVERAHAWAVGRGDLVLSWPADQDAVLALGVPCLDCVTVVHSLEAGPGRAAHVLQVTGREGRHWAYGITALCGRPPRWPA